MPVVPASYQSNTFASSVLPQPGGPASKTPDDDERPRAAKSSACLTGALRII